MASLPEFVMRRYPGVIEATPNDLYEPREPFDGVQGVTAADIADFTAYGGEVTHMVNVVSAKWPYLLRKLRGAVQAPEGLELVLPVITDKNGADADDKGSVYVVSRDDYNESFPQAADMGFVQKRKEFLVRTYKAAQADVSAIDVSAVRDAVFFNGRFEFRNLAEPGDDDYLHYMRQARAMNRQFVKVMRPVVELIRRMDAAGLYLNDLSGVTHDGRVSGFEFLAAKPTMDLDFACALVLYADLSTPLGASPDYSLLDALYEKSPRKGLPYIERFPSMSAALPDSEQEGGPRPAVTWAALAGVTVACALLGA